MQEVLLRLEHAMPFNDLSIRFPQATILRWCNSMVDYLEISSEDPDSLDAIRRALPGLVDHLHSEVLHESGSRKHLSVMVRCRCTAHNSTVRMTEAADCLWKPPVVYNGGKETLTVVALDEGWFRALHKRLSRVANVEILRKTTVDTEVLRDSYTLSLSGLFGNLTPKQLAAILGALDEGYFDIPKRTGLDQLSRTKGLSESTLQEHLSKAERKLLVALAPYLRLYRSTMDA